MNANKPDYKQFIFTTREIVGRHVRLGYRLDRGSQPSIDMEERLTLGDGALAEWDDSSSAVREVLAGLHLIGGVSYWKTSCAPEIVLENDELTDQDALFWSELYQQGLGEFFFTNKLSPVVHFPATHNRLQPEAVAHPAADEKPLLLVGGGKDSVVSAEVIGRAGVTPTLFSVNTSEWIDRAARAIGGVHVDVRRIIDPKLFELNRQGAYNGHVPISAYIAFAAELYATSSGHTSVIASNERSANFPNVSVDGIEVNHQWSKSLFFESSFQQWTQRHLKNGAVYFSLLRPLSELRIARAFSSHPRYWTAVTSCNRNFRIIKDGSQRRWCGECPKCIFVFIVTAPWLNDVAVGEIFGMPFIDDPRAVSIVEELLGISGFKPFDCVGTPNEVSAAMLLLEQQGRYLDSPAMKRFRQAVLPTIKDPERVVADELSPADEDLMPTRWRTALDAYLRHH